ncbi:MAG TPA: DJ-1/PfpI family protein [Cyclobacteriaceae bacterium]|nr:DJ-1/PfpI family protein [Cyclobacteriaceae bacterium]
MKKVLLLLANGFEIYEASVFIDVFGWHRVDGGGKIDLVICGFTPKVTSTFGVTLIPDVTVDQINVRDYDALAIPGGFVEFNFYNEAYSEKFLDLIREFNREKKPISSICTGGLPVAKSGILNGSRGTTYNKGSGVRQKMMREFGVDVVNEPIVVTDQITTSWNPSTAMEVAFLLLEKLSSKDEANLIRDLMGFEKK